MRNGQQTIPRFFCAHKFRYNFIINYKKAKSSDIKKLIELVHQKVLEEYDVDMKIEQEFVNWE